MSSERNSFYAKQGLGSVVGGDRDTASVRSGLLGHGRAESINGSIGLGRGDSAVAAAPSPLTSAREVQGYVEEEGGSGSAGAGTTKE